MRSRYGLELFVLYRHVCERYIWSHCFPWGVIYAWLQRHMLRPNRAPGATPHCCKMVTMETEVCQKVCRRGPPVALSAAVWPVNSASDSPRELRLIAAVTQKRSRLKSQGLFWRAQSCLDLMHTYTHAIFVRALHWLRFFFYSFTSFHAHHNKLAPCTSSGVASPEPSLSKQG